MIGQSESFQRGINLEAIVPRVSGGLYAESIFENNVKVRSIPVRSAEEYPMRADCASQIENDRSRWSAGPS